MKNIYYLIIALVFVISCSKSDGTTGLEMTLIDDGFSVTRGTASTEGEVVIPREWNGRNVMIVGRGAFMGSSQLTRIVIPNTIKSIGDLAFEDCYALESIEIPSSVISIGGGAFAKSGLKQVVVPSSVLVIGDWAFANCRKLVSVVLPDSVQNIGANAFIGCIALKSIAINQQIPPKLGDSVFKDCGDDFLIKVPAGSLVNYRASADWKPYFKNLTEQ